MATLRFKRAGMLVAAVVPFAACSGGLELDEDARVEQAVGDPSPNQVPLDPTTIPQFVTQLPIPRTFAPTVITQNGQVIRHEYTIDVAKTLVQMLPAPLPATNVMAYGGQVKIPGSSATEFVRSVPGSALTTRVEYRRSSAGETRCGSRVSCRSIPRSTGRTRSAWSRPSCRSLHFRRAT
jgi:hypothetical protein